MAQGLLRQVQPYPDLADVQGQQAAKRGLLIAAAGAHLLFSGPPGTGKTLLASRLPGLLPPLDEQEALEVAAIHSVASHSPLQHWPQRPFRQPHHSASGPALVGGGSRPQPGEITLAHQGVLFLDELPEFDRKVLEVLREPLESGHIVIARARDKVRFPARFQLVAAMNPCPCGYLGDPNGRCRCTPEQIQRYRNKLSGPLLDRIDLHLTVAREATALNAAPQTGQSSAVLAAQVAEARRLQLARQGCANAFLDRSACVSTASLPPRIRLAGARLRASRTVPARRTPVAQGRTYPGRPGAGRTHRPATSGRSAAISPRQPGLSPSGRGIRPRMPADKRTLLRSVLSCLAFATGGHSPDTTEGAQHGGKTALVFPPQRPGLYGSAVIILALVIYSVAFQEHAQALFGDAQAWIIANVSWLYILAVALILLMVVLLAFSRYGDIKLGPDHSEPDYSALTGSPCSSPPAWASA